MEEVREVIDKDIDVFDVTHIENYVPEGNPNRVLLDELNKNY